MNKLKPKNYLKNNTGDLALNIIISFTLMFALGFGLMIFLQNEAGNRTSVESSITRSLRETYLIETGRKYSAFYSLTSDKTSLAKNEQIKIGVDLVTTGDEFDTACAVVEWDPQKLKFMSVRPAEMPGNEQAMSVFVKEDGGRRIMCLYVPQNTSSPQNMMTIANTPARFFTLTLESLVTQPKTTVKLSSSTGDQLVHFVNSGISNSVQIDKGSNQIKIQETQN